MTEGGESSSQDTGQWTVEKPLENATPPSVDRQCAAEIGLEVTGRSNLLGRDFRPRRPRQVSVPLIEAPQSLHEGLR